MRLRLVAHVVGLLLRGAQVGVEGLVELVGVETLFGQQVGHDSSPSPVEGGSAGLS